MEKWCFANEIKVRSMKHARDIRKPLEGLLKRVEIDLTSSNGDLVAIKKAIISGYFPNLAKIHEIGSYLSVKHRESICIHSSSGLAKVFLPGTKLKSGSVLAGQYMGFLSDIIVQGDRDLGGYKKAVFNIRCVFVAIKDDIDFYPHPFNGIQLYTQLSTYIYEINKSAGLLEVNKQIYKHETITTSSIKVTKEACEKWRLMGNQGYSNGDLAKAKDMTTKFGKLDKFEGSDFRRWQKKMHFLLTTLKVAYVLSTPRPEFVEEETLEQTRKRCKWDNDDYICRGHILNGMSDALFDVYQNVESAKELWDQLEAKYMAEDTSSKKFLVSNFNNYRMVDSRSVMEQYHELLRILGQYTQHGLFMDESISVSSIIDKLPPSWKDFKHMLKHNKDELSLVQLGSHFRIEETLRMEESGKGKGKDIAGSSSVNMVEDDKNKKNNKNSKDRGGEYYDPSYFQSLGIIHQTMAPYTPQQNGVSGCQAVVRLPKPKKKNLGEKGIDCIFIGYVEHSKAYRFCVIEPNYFVFVNLVIESKDAIFDENRFSSIPRPNDIVSSSNGTQVEGSRDEIASQYSYCCNIEEDPKTFDKAIKS
ncbi:hypothetical protein Tco_1210205 [Tanacetum coccineum]